MLSCFYPAGSPQRSGRVTIKPRRGCGGPWPLVAGLVLWTACAGSQSRLSDIRQDLNTLQTRMDRTAQTQAETRSRQKELLVQIKDLVESEPPVILQPQTGSVPPSASLPPATEPQTATPPPPSGQTPRPVPRGPAVQPGDLQSTPLEAAPRPAPALSPFQAPPPIQVETRALFEEAYADYNQRNYPTAAEKFLLAYQYAKEPERKARSLYWAGVCHFRNQDWTKAIQCFSQMEKEFPEDAALPGALLRKGYSYIYLGDSREGARVLRGLLQRFPKSEEALPARERLREMGES